MNRVNRYLFNNFFSTFGSLFLTLFLIMSIIFFLQIARITSYIEISFFELFKLYFYMLPQILLFTVPISFFVSVAISFFRLSKENEGTVLFALGYSPQRIKRFFLMISAILSAALLVNSLVILPYAEFLNDSFIDYKKTKLNLNLKPGEFGQEFNSWMIFIDNIDEKNPNLYKDIVLYNPNGKNEKFIIAKTGTLVNTNLNAQFILDNGKIVNIDKKSWHVADYKSLKLSSQIEDNKGKEYSLQKYWQESKNDEKMASKLSINTLVSLFPLATILFALSLGIVTYRYEKGFIYVGIFMVILVYFTSLMSIAKYPLYAISIIFSTVFISSYLYFNKKIKSKY